MQYNDEKARRLRISGYDGQISDAWADYLKTSTGWMEGDPSHINDLEGYWLELQGAIGSSLNDKWMDYLGQQGHDLSDHIQDRLHDFWSSEEVLP